MGNYIDPADIECWPSGCGDAACQEKWINYAEQLIEKILGRHFYAKAFDIYVNGNNKNRIFPPLYADILTVTNVYVCEVELPGSWWDFDENSVFLELCQSGSYTGAYAELMHRLSETEPTGLFPHGYNNIRIKGTYGDAAVPEPIKDLIKIIVCEKLNPGTYTKKKFDSEKIGRYSYKQMKLQGYPKEGIYTGIVEADEIIRHYLRQKKAVILTP